MNCAAANERLLELLYDEPEAVDSTELRRHVEQCGRCSAELAALQRTRKALDHWQAPVSAAKTGSANKMTLRPFRGALVGAAAMLALCVGTVGVFGTVESRARGLSISFPKGSVGDEYILLLYSRAKSGAVASAETIQARIAEYGAWAGELDRQGGLVAAEKLSGRDGRVLQRVGDKLQVEAVVSDAGTPHVAGYFQFRADSAEHAERIAAQCPHLKYGGRVEVRRVEKTN